ncbi:MAG: hypothetical protein AAGB04_16145 [Pseudomonadota bacterium]
MPYRSLITSIFIVPSLALTAGAAAKTAEKDEAREQCAAYQKELAALDTPALRERLKEDPIKIAAEIPGEEISKIKRLIELDELLMFRCRLGLKPLQTATKGGRLPAAQQVAVLPDLPIRKPKIKRQIRVQRDIVPLPTRRSDAK